MIVFDCETNGMLDTATKVHTLHTHCMNTGIHRRFTDYAKYHDGTPLTNRCGSIEDGVALLEQAHCVGGHNVIAFDIPVLEKVLSRKLQLKQVMDSLVMSRVIFPNMKDRDFAGVRSGIYPQALVAKGMAGLHSLASWGMRLGNLKGDFKPSDYGYTWETMPFTRKMDDYCEQDTRVNVDLFTKLFSFNYSEECLELEHAVATIIAKQIRTGWQFDVAAAEKLVAKLQILKLEVEDKLITTFGTWEQSRGPFTPKRDNKTLGYIKGKTITRYKTITFNPGSRDHIANRMKAIHDWEPTEFTPSGKPKIDETTLAGLPWSEAKLCAEYLTLAKRLGQIAEGKKAWLKYVKEDGRIHGRVNSNGAGTGRMTHSDPNVAQTPRNTSPYGEECRACWIAKPGYKLVGCDADGLEMRIMAHYMARYDGGEYARTVVEGKSSEGTDAHTLNQKALGFNDRDHAKTWFYAFIYGASDPKLGTIVVDDFDEEKQHRWYAKFPSGPARKKAYQRLGTRSRSRVMDQFPALEKLVTAIKKNAKKRGWLKGLDGRRIPIRSQHSAVNFLFQGGGAIVMKKALVLHDERIRYLGLDSVYVGNIHDEFQSEAHPGHAELVGELAADAIRIAGEYYNLRCPLGGSYSVGDSWSETH